MEQRRVPAYFRNVSATSLALHFGSSAVGEAEPTDLLRDGHRAVVVAMATVHVVQVTLDDVVGVISVRDRVVAAARAVRVVLAVLLAVVRWRALRWVRAADVERVLVDVVAMHVMEMAVMQVVLVTAVLDRLVPAVGAMSVLVLLVDLVVAHDLLQIAFDQVPSLSSGLSSCSCFS